MLQEAMMSRLLWSVFLLLAASAGATDHFVSPTGLDTDPGTEAKPWKTIQHAANAGVIAPGDTVYIRAGTYNERVTVNVSGSAAGGFITFRNYVGESPVLDATGVTPPSSDTGLFLILGRSYVRVQGLELRNYQSTNGTTNQNQVPCGVHIRGASDHIEIHGCKVHDIWNHFADGNAFGIAVYGDAATPMTDIIIDGNEIYQCRLGNSETLTINGNVINWQVTNNLVHDNTNIGIVAIGYEGTCCGGTSDPLLDRARNGVIRGNMVWNCSSVGTPATGVPPNPAYAGAPGAGGIYVDGGHDVLVERNVSYQNDIGIELASEHTGKFSEAVTLRDNVVWRNKIGGLFLGGADATNGGSQNHTITNNTFWENDTNQDGNGEIQFNYRVFNNTLRNNLIVANAQSLLLSNPVAATVGGVAMNTGNGIDYNRWQAPAGSTSAEWQWKNASKTGFTAWKTASGGDAHSSFGDPLLVNPVVSGVAPPAAPDLHLRLDSPCINAGDPAFSAASGETDSDGGTRVTGGVVDIGADELAPRDAWRLQKFGAAAMGATAQFTADPDGDGALNLTEYALNTEPLVPGTAGLPVAGFATVGSDRFLTIAFTRPLVANDVTYTVQAAPALGSWVDGSIYGAGGDVATTATTSQVSRTAGAGTETIVVRDNVPLGVSVSRFLRLRISVP